VAFRGGFTATLSWPEYMTARDLLTQGFALEKSGDDVICRRGDLSIAGTLHLLAPLAEDLARVYDADCRGKTVLDIGGCVGETAVDFARRGAAKVIVYEPAPWNLGYLSRNCAVNKVNAEIHGEGVGSKDEVVSVRYDRADASLGFASTGSREVLFKIKRLADVIEASGADVAKLDCEGGEQALIEVPVATLRAVEIYMIEAHGRHVRDALLGKFAASGFETVKDELRLRGQRPEQEVRVLAFRRLDA